MWQRYIPRSPSPRKPARARSRSAASTLSSLTPSCSIARARPVGGEVRARAAVRAAGRRSGCRAAGRGCRPRAGRRSGAPAATRTSRARAPTSSCASPPARPPSSGRSHSAARPLQPRSTARRGLVHAAAGDERGDRRRRSGAPRRAARRAGAAAVRPSPGRYVTRRSDLEALVDQVDAEQRSSTITSAACGAATVSTPARTSATPRATRSGVVAGSAAQPPDGAQRLLERDRPDERRGRRRDHRARAGDHPARRAQVAEEGVPRRGRDVRVADASEHDRLGDRQRRRR